MTSSIHVRRVLSVSLRAALALFFTTVFTTSASAQLVLQVNGASSASPVNFQGALGSFNLQLTATGGTAPYAFSLTPGSTNVPGLKVRNRPYPMPTNFPALTTGGLLGVLNTLTGSPFTTSLRVTDSLGATDDQPITITATQLQILTNSTIPRPVVGTPYDLELVPFGLIGTASWSATNMPAGLSVNPTTGHIEGTPTTAGNFTNPVITLTDNPSGRGRGITFTIVVNPFDIVTNNTLPEGTLNAAYSQTIQAPSCVSCVFTTTSALPSGMTLATSGVLSGTPTQTSAGFTLNITATGSNGAATEFFLLRIQNNSLQPLSMSAGPVFTSSVGGAFNSNVFLFGGTPPYTVTVDSGALPPGVSLVPDAVAVSSTLTPGPIVTGRAMLPGIFNFTLKATDSLGLTAYRAVTWNVSQLNFGYFTLPLSGTTLQAGTPYTQRLLGLGGSGTYTWTPIGLLPGGLSLDPTTGTVSGTPTDNGSFSTSIQLDDTAGNTFTSNVTFNIAGPTATNLGINGLNAITTLSRGVNFSTNITPGGGTGPFTFTALTPLPPGFNLLSGNASINTNGALMFAGTATTAGTFDFTLKVTDSTPVTPNVGVRTYRIIVTPLNIVTSSLRVGATGVMYSQRLLAVGGTAPIAYSLDTGFTLPAGLTLSAGGNITGTPTQQGSQQLTFVATDALGARITRGLTLTISNLAIVGPDILPSATSGIAYNFALTASGGSGPVTFTAGGLPFGIGISPTGTLSGTTSIGFPQTQSFSINVTANDGVHAVTRRFTMNVVTADPWILSAGANPILGDLLVGQPTTLTLGAVGGVPPYSFALTGSNPLPPGLQLVTGARVTPTFAPGTTLLAGAPTTVGLYTFDLLITDGMGNQTVRTYTVRVTNLATNSAIRTPRVGEAFSFQFTTVGGSGPYTYDDPGSNLQGVPTLPPGLTLSPSGLLSGTPTSSGVFTFRVVVHDSLGSVFSRFYSVTVADFINGGPSGGLFIGQGSASGAITSLNPADNPVGVWADFFFSLFRVNGPFVPATWSLVGGSLPPGLSLMGDTLGGRPSTAGVYVFRMRGNDIANPTQFAEHEYTMRIVPMQVVAPQTTLGFGDRTSLPNARVGDAYSFRIRVAGGTAPYTFSTPALPTTTFLPAGLTLDASGILSGTPTQSGTYTPGFVVSDSAGHHGVVTNALQLTIAPAGGNAPLIVDEEQNDGELPVPIGVDWGTSLAARLDLSVRSGVAPFTWSLAPGSNLPPGTAVVSGGGAVSDIIAGKPTTPGTYSFTLNVVDGAGQMASSTISNVRVTSLAISPLRLPTGVVGTPYNAALTVSGGTPPYGPMQLIEGSSISPGLTLSTGGVLSGTPTAPGNYLLAPIYSDIVSMEYFIYRLTIDSSSPAGEAKAVSLSPSAIDVSRPLGAPTAPIPLTINITSGHPAFTAVITGIPGATISANTGTTPAVLSVNLNTETLAQGVYHGMVGVRVNGTANIDEMTPIIVTIGPPPVVQALTVTPNTGTGVRQTFTLTYSDSVGVAADLKRAMVRFGASTVSACVADYNAITAKIRLFDDAGVAGAPAPLGSGTLSNSQCTLNLATSTATPAGNNLTLALDISFTAAFTGVQPIAMRAMSNAGPNTGFVAKGTWTVGLPAGGVQAISITPNAGSGSTQTFVLAYSDSAGVAADLKVARVRFIPAGGGPMCMIDYNAITNLVRMMGNDGVTWSPFVPFGGGSLSNDRCGLILTQGGALRNGTDLTLTLALTFNPAFAGAKNIDMRANSNFGPTTGFINKGTWTVP